MCENIYNSMENMGFVATLQCTQLHTRKGRSYNARIHFKTPASETVIAMNHD